jgi:hypothetical protein
VWLAHVICSGRECAEEVEVVIDELEELDEMACHCSHGFVVLSISDVALV